MVYESTIHEFTNQGLSRARARLRSGLGVGEGTGVEGVWVG